MEDVLKYLLVVGIILYGMRRKARKEVPKSSPQRAEDRHEVPAAVTESPLAESVSPPRTHTARPAPPERGKPSAGPAPASGDGSDFDARSLEEVRKGIIWSEILHRKY